MATLVSIALLGVCVDGADASKRTFKPIKKTARTLVFNPKGIDKEMVREAHVKLRVNSNRVERRVGVQRVRRALGNPRLRVHRPLQAKRPVLNIKVTPPPVDPPPIDPPPIDPPPIDPPPIDPPPIDPPPTDGCGWGTFDSQNQPGACWRPYSDLSPFNRGVGTAPRTLSSSSAIVSRLTGFGKGQGIIGGVADTPDDWDHALYFSKPSDPVYTVHCVKDWGVCDVEGTQVRIPSRARPAAGGDGSLGVIDQASGWEYDFWQVVSKPTDGGVLRVSWGGRTPIGTSGADGLGSNGTAAHFGTAAGVIRPEELEAGEINHALDLVVKCTNGTFVWPASGPGVGRTCSSMGLSDANAPALGQHFFLDMTDQQIAALSVPAWKKTILRAMAHYGMFVGDTGGNTWRLKVESGSSYTSFGQEDPWVKLGKQFGVPSWQSSSDGGTRYSFDTAAGVDWSRLKVADPCVSRGTC